MENKTDEKAYVEGNDTRTEDLKKLFPISPSTMLIKRLMEEMGKQKGFKAIFGPMRAYDEPQQRWSCFMRSDWSMRQLPAINIYQSDPEVKTNDNGWLSGNVRIMVLWPAGLRRHDWAEVPLYFKGAIQSWFASKYVVPLLDPAPGLAMDTKVGGLNELGRELTWSPQVEGVIASQTVPVTICDVKYRIDLRRWYDFLEENGYCKDEPFIKTIFPAEFAEGVFQGMAFGSPDGNATVSAEIKISDAE